MNISSIRAAIRRRLDNRDSSDLPDATIDEWVNAVRRRIYEEVETGYIETTLNGTTVSGTNTIDYPSDYLEHIALTIGGTSSTDDKKIMVQWNVERFIKKYGDFTNTASLKSDKPEIYVVYGRKFYLYPVPDDAYLYTLFYKALPADISDSNITEDFLGNYYICVIAGAAYLGAIELNEVDLINTNKADFMEAMQLLKRAENKRKIRGVPTFKPRKITGEYPDKPSKEVTQPYDWA